MSDGQGAALGVGVFLLVCTLPWTLKHFDEWTRKTH